MSVQGGEDDVQRVEPRTTLEGRTMTSEVRPTRLRAAVDRRDRVRWGPVWAGTVVAAAVAFLLGGVVAGASLANRDAEDGLLHGLLVWRRGSSPSSCSPW